MPETCRTHCQAAKKLPVIQRRSVLTWYKECTLTDNEILDRRVKWGVEVQLEEEESPYGTASVIRPKTNVSAGNTKLRKMLLKKKK